MGSCQSSPDWDEEVRVSWPSRSQGPRMTTVETKAHAHSCAHSACLCLGAVWPHPNVLCQSLRMDGAFAVSTYAPLTLQSLEARSYLNPRARASCSLHVSLGLYTTATEGTGLYTLREWLHTLIRWLLPHSVYVLWISWLHTGRSYTHLPARMTPRTLSGEVRTWSFNKALGFS